MKTKATGEGSSNEPEDAPHPPAYEIPEVIQTLVNKASEMTSEKELTDKQRRIKNFLVYFSDVMDTVDTERLGYAEDRAVAVVKAIARGEDIPPTAAAADDIPYV